MKEPTVEELKELLKFALHNLRYELEYGDPEMEYGYCCVCGSRDWEHDPECKALAWEKKVKEIFK
jgi:hypothetical protein